MAHNKRNQLRELHLFAGAGGGILGGMLCGHRTVCAVELEEYPREVLLQRQRDGILPEFPIWDDVRTFDGKPWRGKVDVVCGGFPCQDISCAGKGAGIDGERSGMWGEMARIIGEIRPKYAFVENSPMLVGRGLARVIGDLAEMGYDARWGVLGSFDQELPTIRQRLWIVASSTSVRLEGNRKSRKTGERLDEQGLWTSKTPSDVLRTFLQRYDAARVRGINDGLGSKMDRLKAIGNGQVPAVAALAWNTLMAETLVK